ncbi:MAG: Ribosome association toxin PasT (RatA) of the RatAB toxin-antitoxin module [Candidatus Kentron sp. G]|uniref:Ribosome association toxin PasT (RatA) of the RatAB toxin-antitoxin module n=1 Tax=Candidatus Kentrum sp. FM TaxID=2126340 RepID=A0A450TBN0_9GAMM|nr:MAG: Ribosome association toxin PasT (RatA) of the RatAB toxin-antitoxin module [Candidatus Kentron sp. FM]VFM95547.1 MAG: Ribosome association toxin PasT (RatA) of the RatAB toxin-antitoxin module [Candidatus Kentron sp. G]VFJ64252.1 MAG: Ribosome association toxin PasT (RatA) of the RatAB toxin-antitoxin module [Candidatus Kentron sp. FM]VFK14853.1 MAG: Ribosome association toxin PasT (RatA) of the RatAB toxin-antitoxin module [Candidatus Kentron sp. FM]VFM96823.1 MAG: Ribosome association
MTIIHRNALVPYSAADMYALVADVSSYPEFLPWCSMSNVEPLTETEVQASLEISHGRLRKSFSTLNRMEKDQAIEMHLLDGPFTFLEGRWRFEPLSGEGCKVSFDMDFEFSNRITKMLIGATFTEIANTLVDAFCTRAAEVYGAR